MSQITFYVVWLARKIIIPNNFMNKTFIHENKPQIGNYEYTTPPTKTMYQVIHENSQWGLNPRYLGLQLIPSLQPLGNALTGFFSHLRTSKGKIDTQLKSTQEIKWGSSWFKLKRTFRKKASSKVGHKSISGERGQRNKSYHWDFFFFF